MDVGTKPLSAKTLVSLDGIRGLAILGVMLHHRAPRLWAASFPLQFLKWLFYSGWAGVDLFFVLSGFLITGILLDSRNAINYFRSFYARRVLRIFPLYYAFLLVAFLGFPLVAAADWMPLPGDRWLYFCYLTNWQVLWIGPWRHSVMAHLWSLAVEEQFYFCWPLLVWALRPRILLPALLIAEGAIIGARTGWVLTYGPSQAVAMATVTRMDGLLLGAVCAILVRQFQIPDRSVRSLPLLAGCGLFLYILQALSAANTERFVETTGFPLLAVCFSVVILYAVLTDGHGGSIQSILCQRTLTNVGKYAYGIYVCHVPLFYFADRLVNRFVPQPVRDAGWFGYAATAVLMVASYHVAKLSYTRFERRFLKLKRKFDPTYAPSMAATV